ncbi:MAG TPA: class I SAM-dependent methyltransferase [Prosthecochloris aestuarii]|uniref:Class I SAM-dependent methyltransferase n=1 Tax=Prosthecochloris aestuarii TaxID=1102 RepID=A0A831SUI5_PROAE|nr:class I SAM-dependent methyltransferase [Prosthecochloris aestuarii]
MSVLPDVSMTAYMTLAARAGDAGLKKPLIHDRRAVELLSRLRLLLKGDVVGIEALRIPVALRRYIVLRADRYDRYSRDFLSMHPDGLVVSLGSGFDTRCFRVGIPLSSYIELDLPELVELKRRVTHDWPKYRMIGRSVIGPGWIEEVRSEQPRHVLFLAEGLFMYLPENEVKTLIRRLSGAFRSSSLVFEVVHRRYTRGMWKRLVDGMIHHVMGNVNSSSYESGIESSSDIESWAEGIRVEEEWCYLQDPRLRPRVLQLLQYIDYFARVQWTIVASLNR